MCCPQSDHKLKFHLLFSNYLIFICLILSLQACISLKDQSTISQQHQQLANAYIDLRAEQHATAGKYFLTLDSLQTERVINNKNIKELQKQLFSADSLIAVLKSINKEIDQEKKYLSSRLDSISVNNQSMSNKLDSIRYYLAQKDSQLLMLEEIIIKDVNIPKGEYWDIVKNDSGLVINIQNKFLFDNTEVSNKAQLFLLKIIQHISQFEDLHLKVLLNEKSNQKSPSKESYQKLFSLNFNVLSKAIEQNKLYFNVQYLQDDVTLTTLFVYRPLTPLRKTINKNQ